MKKTKFGSLLLSIMFIFLLSGCQQQEKQEQSQTNIPKENISKTVDESKSINIVTTIFPLYDISKNIIKDKGEVSLLLSPGMEPHAYDPTAKDIKKILDSDLFVYVGEAMEPWAHEILEGSNYSGEIIEASEYVDLINVEEEEENHDNEEVIKEEDHEDENHDEDHEHFGYDPHIWLDFENDIKISNQILSTLYKIIEKKDNPNNELRNIKDLTLNNYYKENQETYNKELTLLDEEYKSTLATCSERTFITGGHNAYSYLAKKYNLEFYSVHGLSPDSEPTPDKIKDITNISKEKNIKFILSEKLLNQDMTQSIASEVGAEVLIFNPAGNISKDEFESGKSFIEIMEENLKSLQTSLNCNL